MSLSSSEPDLNIRDVFRRAFGEPDSAYETSQMRLFTMVHRAYNVVSTVNEDFLRPYNLTGAKLRMLAWLKACDKIGYNDGLLPSQLSRFQNVSPNTTSSLLHGLQKQGLIRRVKHPTDNRKYIITITDAGREVIDEVGPRYFQFMKSVSGGLSSEENQILITLLNKLTNNLLEATNSPLCQEEHTSEAP